MRYRFKKVDQAVEFMRWLTIHSMDFNFRPDTMFCVEVVEEPITKQEIEEINRVAFLRNGAYT